MNKESVESGAGNGGERTQSGGLAGKSREVAEQAKQATLERVDSVRQSTQSAKDVAAERLRKLSGTMRKLGEHLRIEDQTYVAERAASTSDRLDGFANYLSSADLSTLVRDTGAVARKNPAAFFGSAFLIGLAAGRVLKAGGHAVAPGAGASMEKQTERSVTPRHAPSARASTEAQR
jgi:hypothetical protein